MEQMAEFVEDCLNLAMGQQRGLIPDRRSQVATDQPEMRLETPSGSGRPVRNASIQAPPRLFSRGYQSA